MFFLAVDCFRAALAVFIVLLKEDSVVYIFEIAKEAVIFAGPCLVLKGWSFIFN